jgi:mono/diheme cytochrome c family protein
MNMRYEEYGRGTIVFFCLGCLLAVCWVVGAVAKADEPAGAGVVHSAGDAVRGRQLFKNYGCFSCHGTEGQGASTGPKLAPGPLPLEAFRILVRNPANVMPPYSEKVLSEDELRDMHAFLASIGTVNPDELRKIGRGRP